VPQAKNIFLNAISSETDILEIVDFGELPVFEDASTFPMILSIASQKPTTSSVKYSQIDSLDFANLRSKITSISIDIDKTNLIGPEWKLGDTQSIGLLNRLENDFCKLKDIFSGQIKYGIKTGLNEVFVIDANLKRELELEHASSSDIIKPYVSGDDVRKYIVHDSGKYVVFTRKGTNIKHYPAVERYLEKFRDRLTPGAEKGRRVAYYAINWFEIQDTVAHFKEFEQPKIVYPIIGKTPRFTIDYTGFYSSDKTYIIPTGNRKLLALLNSPVVWFFLMHTCSTLGDALDGGRLELRKIYMDRVPLPSLEENEFYITRMDSILSETQIYYSKVSIFLTYIEKSYSFSKITNKMKCFDHASISEFASLLRRRTDITEKEKMNLISMYTNLVEDLVKIRFNIRGKEDEVNKSIYREYKCSISEISLIESKVGDLLFDGKVQ
jgi:hypothetical protein